MDGERKFQLRIDGLGEVVALQPTALRSATGVLALRPEQVAISPFLPGPEENRFSAICSIFFIWAT